MSLIYDPDHIHLVTFPADINARLKDSKDRSQIYHAGAAQIGHKAGIKPYPAAIRCI